MGGSPQAINLVSLSSTTRSQRIRRRRHMKTGKRPRRITMKGRSRRRFGGLEGSRRPRNGVGRRVEVLKKLIPSSSDSMGLDGLFRETADYILALEMRVKFMQVMVKALSTV